MGYQLDAHRLPLTRLPLTSGYNRKAMWIAPAVHKQGATLDHRPDASTGEGQGLDNNSLNTKLACERSSI